MSKKMKMLTPVIMKMIHEGDSYYRYPNLLNKNFHADRLNQKWVTDISYRIQTKIKLTPMEL